MIRLITPKTTVADLRSQLNMGGTPGFCFGFSFFNYGVAVIVYT